MNHKVNNVGDLYSTASALYNEVVAGGSDSSADSIINNLSTAISNLKSCWEGKDAGIQIQNIIEVHNAMVQIRNALASLAADATSTAAYYREIQNANGAGLESYSRISFDTKTDIEDYTDNRDTINITPDANNGKAKVDLANSAISGFIDNVRRYYDDLMNNWTAGTGRDAAQGAFEDFLTNSSKYREKLAEVSNTIAQAIQNYSF